MEEPKRKFHRFHSRNNFYVRVGKRTVLPVVLFLHEKRKFSELLFQELLAMIWELLPKYLAKRGEEVVTIVSDSNRSGTETSKNLEFNYKFELTVHRYCVMTRFFPPSTPRQTQLYFSPKKVQSQPLTIPPITPPSNKITTSVTHSSGQDEGSRSEEVSAGSKRKPSKSKDQTIVVDVDDFLPQPKTKKKNSNQSSIKIAELSDEENQKGDEEKKEFDSQSTQLDEELEPKTPEKTTEASAEPATEATWAGFRITNHTLIIQTINSELFEEDDENDSKKKCCHFTLFWWRW
eukprot:TRINITY_DN12839_c0_g1_i1.p1 TRINITY_DN12839_c0_g1~~TRINITY_DN12839_c0_g1_i1.p1  ORF type:complete len:291 (+),score=80.18 TRINITY_DN12839_c0_g1_i1:55-927(+)